MLKVRIKVDCEASVIQSQLRKDEKFSQGVRLYVLFDDEASLFARLKPVREGVVADATQQVLKTMDERIVKFNEWKMNTNKEKIMTVCNLFENIY